MKQLSTNAKVAVVGNGPFHREWGDFIDGCDIVIRFNTFVVEGFERYVGSKTTIWCFASNHEKICLRHNDYLNQHNVNMKQIWVVRRIGRKQITPNSKFYGIAKNRGVELSILMFDEQLTGREVGVRFPSTGIVALRRAMIECEGMPIYLFGFNGFQKNEKLHYFSPDGQFPPQGGHNGLKETAYVRHKIAEGAVIDLLIGSE